MTPTSAWYRALAILAWMVSLLWYGALYLGFWGITSGAMLVWSLLGVPLEVLSRRWLATAGAPVGSWARRATTWVWAGLMGVQALLYTLMALPLWNGIAGRLALVDALASLNVVYGLFPVLVSVIGIHRAANVRPVDPSAPAI